MDKRNRIKERFQNPQTSWQKQDEKIDEQISFLGVALPILFIILSIMFLFALQCNAETVEIETIAREASGQSFDAQVLVASVIKTRMAERHQTAEQVCKSPRQFSCWNNGVHQKPRTKAELATARKAWDAAKATGANLYHDTSVSPRWSKSKKVKFLCKVGRIKFYREG